MKQFQFAYQNDEALLKELEEIKQWCAANPSYNMLFRIYSNDMDLDHIRHICDLLDEHMPDALYLGCTSNANLLGGAFVKASITLTCTVFEYETTHVRVMQLPFTEESAKETVGELKSYCNANPWVKSVEIHATMLGISVRTFCDEMSTLPSDIQVFGGGAYNPGMDTTAVYVFSKGNDFSDSGVVFLLLGGSDYYVHSTYIAGWKPLTRKFKVTKAKGAVLYELDGELAFNTYKRLLNLETSDYFVANALQFPLYMDYKGLDVLRCPLGLNRDGSLVMATEVPEDSDVRFAFGYPEAIISSIRRGGQIIADFRPDVIQTFSCAARKGFWGDESISDETSLFNRVAPTSGAYVGGEFMRLGGMVRNFNITLILAAMREGEPKAGSAVNIRDTKLDSIENEEQIPLIRRFVSFVEATTRELESANQQLEIANQQLEKMNIKLAISSVTDGLTGLYNRTETEHNIKKALEEQESNNVSLIMLDIDNFKKVNDTYGHAEGDLVIIALADVLRKVLGDVEFSYSGRWGGEEFMVLLQNEDVNEASALAEEIRSEFAAISYKTAIPQTVSIGVTQAKLNENYDVVCSRVDKALYTAKADGKNRVVIL